MTSDTGNLLNELKIDRETPVGTAGRWPPGVWVGALIALLAGVALWWSLRGPAEISVTTTRAQALRGQRADSVLDASGYVTARRRATVSSQITGKVKRVLVEEGMRVAAGQVVATLDDTTEQTRLRLAAAQRDAARSKVAEIKAQLQQSQLAMQRTRRLSARELASQSELDAARASRDSLQARVVAAQSDIVVAQRNMDVVQDQLDQTIIRAPFAGVVVAKNAQPGEMISPISAGGGFTRTGICTIVDMQSLEVDVDVNEAYIHRVVPGQAVTAVLDAYPDWRIQAHVVAIVPTADRQRATVKVRIGFAKRDPRILPDMGVKVNFLGTQPVAPEAGAVAGGVRVPSAAVHSDDAGQFVWSVEADRVHRRQVRIISIVGDTARIATGLSAGQSVVLSSSSDLSDGAVVHSNPTEP